MAVELVLSIMHVCINPNLNPLSKFRTSSTSARIKDILQWNISDIVMKTISISQINEKKHRRVSSKENHWKLGHQREQNFSKEGRPLQNKFLVLKLEIGLEKQDCEGHWRIGIGKLTI